MRSGLELLNESSSDKEAEDTLRWHIVSALVKEERIEEAEKELLLLNLSNPKNFKLAFQILLSNSSDEVINWFESHIEQLSSESLIEMISENQVPSKLKVVAASRLGEDSSNKMVEGELIQLCIETDDIVGLAKILREIEEGPSKYPL